MGFYCSDWQILPHSGDSFSYGVLSLHSFHLRAILIGNVKISEISKEKM